MTLIRALADSGYETFLAEGPAEALLRANEYLPDLVLAYASVARAQDSYLLKGLRSTHPEIPFIILGAAEAGDETYQHLDETPDFETLRLAVERALAGSDSRPAERRGARGRAEARGTFGELVGQSEPMRQIYTLIEQVAPSSASVLITGESGTGKELVARTIHKLSPRARAAFVPINCSAIPETLMESELFGHERGAFTGASSRRQGCFELADGGTLLLDEIAEMPPLLQAKLLRVLEERSVRRLGGAHEIPVDVRVLAATNRDPVEATHRGDFREDLLYRLNVITIELPPLRRRREDIGVLARHLVAQLAERHGRRARALSPAALEALKSHHWPGNVRELRNVIERAVIICSGDTIERAHLAPYPLDQRARVRSEDTITLPVGTPLEEVERQMILRTLHKTDNNKRRAAELLQISLKTLHNKLRSYRERGILPDPEEQPSRAPYGGGGDDFR
ncbi:MAG TPA: sigma-54 dependent transcriptional regulator [Pyrinomonadaceae bacterium]|nr:sigma-54 dependent transcriptional regulator [Pyrinomonadaceae bacterium]